MNHLREFFQTVAEAEIGGRVISAIDPLFEDDFLIELRSIGTILFHLCSELQEEDARVVGWCSRLIGEKADAIKEAVTAVRVAARSGRHVQC